MKSNKKERVSEEALSKNVFKMILECISSFLNKSESVGDGQDGVVDVLHRFERGVELLQFGSSAIVVFQDSPREQKIVHHDKTVVIQNRQTEFEILGVVDFVRIDEDEVELLVLEIFQTLFG